MSQQALQRDTILFSTRGSYYIEDIIGRGGFGITYSASADGINLPSNVAIKEFFPKELCSRTPEPDSFDLIINSIEKVDMINKLRDRFVKESRNIQRCSHPSIVRVLDTIECNGTAYMVMELIDGQTLKQLQANLPEQKFSPERARDIIESAARALKYLHENRMTHLDIKPDNIMLTDNGKRVVLIDFGLSRQFNDDGSSTSEVLTAVSKGYAPPEQYLGITTFSPESDIYSLGATFYKLLTGKTPPEPLVLKNNPNALEFPAKIPANYRKAILRAMTYDSQQRINSVAEFINILDGRRITTPLPPKPPGGDEIVPAKKRHLLGKILLTIGLIGIVAGCLALIVETSGSSRLWYDQLFTLSSKERITDLAITATLATIGVFASGYRFKWFTFILSFIALFFLFIN